MQAFQDLPSPPSGLSNRFCLIPQKGSVSRWNMSLAGWGATREAGKETHLGVK